MPEEGITSELSLLLLLFFFKTLTLGEFNFLDLLRITIFSTVLTFSIIGITYN